MVNNSKRIRENIIITQLIVGSFKKNSVNGVNSSIRTRNDALSRNGFEINYFRIDGIKNFLKTLYAVKHVNYVFVDSIYYFPSILIAIFLKIKYRSKILLWSHGAFNIFDNELKKKIYLFFLSKLNLGLYLMAGKSETKFANLFNFKNTIIGNSVSKVFDVKLNSYVEPNLILYVGRYDPFGKGFDRMWQYLRLNNNLKLHMYGKGKSFEIPIDIKNRVKIFPPVFGKNKIDKISSSEAVILTSRREGLPMICLESLYIGTPIIISKECNLDKDLGIYFIDEKFTSKNNDRIKISNYYKTRFSTENYVKKIVNLLND